MVSKEISINHTTTASSLAVTPQLTINRDAALDLDSTNAFEGPEKLLEVWFCASPDVLPASARSTNGLKSVSATIWADMLDLVNCKILSVVESPHVDAYLLSESSMFVFPHKLILKTCGTTTLLYGLPRILEIARAAGFPHISGDLDTDSPTGATPWRVFYSRKNFLFPERQQGPHRSWRDEVKSLDSLFRNGSAYIIGKLNGDHWYLYLTPCNLLLTPPTTPPADMEIKHLDVPAAQADKLCRGSGFDCQDDETLELLMTDLDTENAKQFYVEHASAIAKDQNFAQAAREDAEKNLGFLNDPSMYGIEVASNEDFQHISSDSTKQPESATLPSSEELITEGHALGTIVSDTSGLADIYPVSKYPDAKIDAYLFSPCGFSANGVIPGSQTNHYFTVHVTPEESCSFASFETNVPCKQTGRQTVDLIEQVVGIFKPGRFSVTLFEAKTSDDSDDLIEAKDMEKVRNAKGLRMDNIKGYRRVERINHLLEGYDLIVRFYERDNFKGGEPRIGEDY